MTQHQEKKYLVTSFANILEKLDACGAKKQREIVSTHYYAQTPGSDIIKLVEYTDRNEIHILKSSNGNFSLINNLPLKSLKDGFLWMKTNGYPELDVVRMCYTNYEYKNGIIGLYIINDFLKSVILDYPQEQGLLLEKEFGLENTEVIMVPFNQFLKKTGKLKVKKLKARY